MKRPRIRFSRRNFLVGFVALVAGAGLAYLFVPELLVWSGTLLIAEVEPFPADAIVVLGGGGPDRAREAADLFNDGLAPRVLITTEEAPDNYRELAELGIELVLPYENYLRVLNGFGVAEEDIFRIEDSSSESMDELLGVRRFAADRDWRRLIVVTSNYHSRRALLITDFVFDAEWQIAVVGSRYSEFRPNGWWREVRHVRTFLIEFQKLLAYELYLRPRMLF
jgi:uncharacterized SAM-binding protein YcdF (DUF218 family)